MMKTLLSIAGVAGLIWATVSKKPEAKCGIALRVSHCDNWVDDNSGASYKISRIDEELCVQFFSAPNKENVGMRLLIVNTANQILPENIDSIVVDNDKWRVKDKKGNVSLTEYLLCY